jgi:hypothetical protein
MEGFTSSAGTDSQFSLLIMINGFAADGKTKHLN